ncbi:MAG: ABC transporter permease subunit [Thermoplasmata archaeon]
MDFETIKMELKKGWKGYIIFILIVMLISAGMAQLYPFVSEAFEEEGMGLNEEKVSLEIGDDFLYLSWEKIEADEYIILEDSRSNMATSWVVDNTTDNNITIPREDTEKERYFGVIAVVDGKQIPVGITSNVERKSQLEEMMDTPYFRMFTAGREDVRMDEIEGYLSVELYSWWILLVGIYLSYLSVKSVTGDYEKSRMDIIFSTPLSRGNYLLQKYSALGVFTLILVGLSGLVLTLSVYSLGEGMMFGTFFVSILISWPMFMVMIAISFLFAVLFKNSRGGIGASFAVILVQYTLFMAGHMLESLEFILPCTIIYYWDYNSVLLDGIVYPLHLVLLTAIAVVIMAATLWIFRNSDIPA